MTVNTQITILRRLLDPENGELSPEAARFFLHLDFPQWDHDRMAELAAKAGTGKLTRDEQEELNEYGRVGDFLAILQSKARKSLQRVECAS